MRPPTQMLVPAPGAAGPLGDAMLAGLGLRGDGGDGGDGGEQVERTILDTFDWRVWGAGGILEHAAGPSGAWLSWRDRRTGGTRARQPSPAVPTFSGDLGDGPVRRLLEPVLDVRALLARARTHVLRRGYSLVDDDSRTVARLFLDHSDLGDWVVATGAPGCASDLRRLVVRLSSGLHLVPAQRDPAEVAMEAAGARPGDYSSKLRVVLPGDAGASTAYVAVCSTLLDTIEVNEPGVRDNVDTEFLHDLRVAIRRGRTLLGEARGVLPAAVVARTRDDLRWIAGLTGEVRDLDVWLLGLGTLVEELSPSEVGELGPLRDLLSDLRRKEHASLVEALDSPRYRDLLQRWRAFLEDPFADETTPDAGQPIRLVAGQRISRAYRGVVRRGRAVDAGSPAESYHDLRKRAKRLRYLLESFRSLYPARHVARSIAELKRLQDNLGQMQDCAVQIGGLRRLAEMLEARPGPSAGTVLTMGALGQHLARREEGARRAFPGRFSRFDRRKTGARFERLVRGP